jgi:ubiquitin
MAPDEIAPDEIAPDEIAPDEIAPDDPRRSAPWLHASAHHGVPPSPQARLHLTTLAEVPPDEQRCCICCCEYAAGDRMLTLACKCSPRRPRVSPQVRCRRSHAHARMQAQLPPRVHRAVAGAEDELPALQAAGARRGRHIGRSILGKAALAEATSARGNSHLQTIHTSGDVRPRQPSTTEPL